MSHDDAFAPELLDLHLNRLTPGQREIWRARIAADPKLAEQHEALGSLFKTLQSWRVEPAPADLPARIAARIAGAGQPLRLVRPTDDLTRAAEAGGTMVIRLGNLREIVAVAAMLVLIVSVGLPSLLSVRERNQRMGCSQNLALLGQGVQQYAATFGSSLPFAGWSPQASWRPSGDPHVVTIPNRIHLYPLLRGAYVLDPRVFVCPARKDVPMPQDQVRERNDFSESRNLSYAYQNMAGVRPLSSSDPRLPIMADDNPAFEDGVPLFDRLGLGDRANRNSRAHKGAGQNVLMLDGHFKWSTTPYAGIDNDNIWTLQGIETYNGHEGPGSASDAHLLK